MNKIKQFFALASPYFIDSRVACFTLLYLVLSTFTVSGLYGLISYIQRDIYNGLSENNSKKFYHV
jgi:hypothetical protein